MLMIISTVFYLIQSGSQKPDKPNIILIQVDALRPDHLGCYGYVRNTSPNIDEFSKKYLVFENAYATWPQTSQSVASMMTSRYSGETGIRKIRSFLSEDLLTLAEILLDEGYYTAGFVANGNLGIEFNFNQGFIEYSELWKGERRTGGRRNSYTADIVTPKVLEWLRGNQSHPFFLWVFYIDPHGPYIPPNPYNTFFKDDFLYNTTTTEVNRSQMKNYQWLKDRNVNHYVSRYDGEIRYVDEWLGKLFEELSKQNLYRDSVIIFTADHGEALGEHNKYFMHATFLHEPQVKVPLFIYYPGVEHGFESVRVSLIDLTPTILDLAGLETNHTLRGASIMPVIEGREDSRLVFLELNNQTAVVDGDLKLVYNHWEKKYHLFNLTADSHEIVELDNPSEKQRLSLILENWLLSHRKVRTKSKRPKADPETIKQLRELGYLN
jgi:arylsulfatase A-like enzyme